MDREEMAYARICAVYDSIAPEEGPNARVLLIKEMCRNLGSPECFARFAHLVDRFAFLVRNPLLCHASSCRGQPVMLQAKASLAEGMAGTTLEAAAAASGFSDWDEYVRYCKSGPDVSRLAHERLATSICLNIHPEHSWAQSLREAICADPLAVRFETERLDYDPIKVSTGILACDGELELRMMSAWSVGWMGAALIWRRLQQLPAERVIAVDCSILRARPTETVHGLCDHFGVSFGQAMVNGFVVNEQGAQHLESWMKNVWMPDSDACIRPPYERPPKLQQLAASFRQLFRDVSCHIWLETLGSSRLLLPISKEELLATPVSSPTEDAPVALRCVDPVLEYALALAGGILDAPVPSALGDESSVLFGAARSIVDAKMSSDFEK